GQTTHTIRYRAIKIGLEDDGSKTYLPVLLQLTNIIDLFKIK
ncbi:hypothetical protein HMPREF9148_02117, partial [Prevotella sp. F0091]